MRGSGLAITLVCWLAALACAAARPARVCLEPGETASGAPFELTVELSDTEVTVGQVIEVTYHLRNTSDAPVGACPLGLDEFHVINSATKANRGLIHGSTTVSTSDLVRLPPKATLTWIRPITIPDVGVGEATFMGTFHSFCLWSGVVWSKPVQINVVASESDGR